MPFSKGERVRSGSPGIGFIKHKGDVCTPFTQCDGAILVTATLGIGGAILTESALSFLGLGVQPPTSSWGNILTAGKDYITVAWWLSLYPGLAILVTVLAYNLLGEGFRDVLDPRIMAE